jgi:proteasome lid subunit RPN8/RPN11
MFSFVLRIPRTIIREFRSASIEQYPKEAYAVLLGQYGVNSTGVEAEIEEVWYPSRQRSNTMTTSHIYNYEPWKEEAQEFADSGGYSILGDIHSHPYRCKQKKYHFGTLPSLQDWSASEEQLVFGICAVNRLDGGKFRTQVKFWLPSRKVDTVLV